MIHQHPLRVYIEDTDVGGIVYYVNYLKFMERARTELLRVLGYQQQRLKEEGLLFVVHSLQSRYRQPARLDDELTVETTIQALASASLVFVQRVIRICDQTVLCTAEVRVAAVDSEKMRPTPLPKAMVAALKAYEQKPESLMRNGNGG
ncbi:tol-pal system-associated acyl-CoA thioesterase [Motiliproteus sediminis]|uniref:tol-pal system-associated acyl-CoA thioesterase n=1 Tax=Motiliproteus sediminis TaxID=1468178 RepID=UPI001AEF8C2E|nr:tol-pal system-associated acyl-CoA thioesterase [Motiliproteus sediminis]